MAAYRYFTSCMCSLFLFSPFLIFSISYFLHFLFYHYLLAADDVDALLHLVYALTGEIEEEV